VRVVAIMSGVLMGLSEIMVATARDPWAMMGSWNGRGQVERLELPALAVCCLLTPGGPQQCRHPPHPNTQVSISILVIDMAPLQEGVCISGTTPQVLKDA